MTLNNNLLSYSFKMFQVKIISLYFCHSGNFYMAAAAKSAIPSDRFDRSPTCLLSFLYFSGTEPVVKAVIQVPPSDSVRSVTLQCSVLSDSDNTTCRTERNVCWFQSGPDASYPSVFAAHGGSQDGCQGGVRGGAPQKWESSISELLGSSDAGPFSCAVVTCGEFFFGTLNFRTAGVLDETSILEVLLAAALVASVIVNVCLVWILKGKSSSCCKGTFFLFLRSL